MIELPNPSTVLIIGASTRAAAFAALRAQLRPWCVDLFNDADLKARCPTVALVPGAYPRGLVEVVRRGPPGPWMYTGGLENRPALVRELARLRPLWGNDSSSLAIVRSPRALCRLLRDAGLCCPALRTQPPDGASSFRWLRKPWAGAGGAGIRFWEGSQATRPRKRVYFQEYIEGDACSAAYLGDAHRARLLGVTRQLVGEPWLNAARFHYCGSIGPLRLPSGLRQAVVQLGDVLVKGAGLRGLFGVDFVLRDGVPWPVEVNPRYTASMEVLEYSTHLPALALHRSVFDQSALAPVPAAETSAAGWVGKAVLFARDHLVFACDGPWQSTLRHPLPVEELPDFADIPRAGQRIKAGSPVLTLFARGASPADCLDALRQTAGDLDRRLFGR
jgi:predicted ATP-grasp superfamily ATP-dependent carboligase